MKDSEVYLKAAELVAETKEEFFSSCKQWYCCDAIMDAHPASFIRRQEDFVDQFSPNPIGEAPERIWEPGPHYMPTATGKDQQARILALCFMAAIAKSEGR